MERQQALAEAVTGQIDTHAMIASRLGVTGRRGSLLLSRGRGGRDRSSNRSSLLSEHTAGVSQVGTAPGAGTTSRVGIAQLLYSCISNLCHKQSNEGRLHFFYRMSREMYGRTYSVWTQHALSLNHRCGNAGNAAAAAVVVVLESPQENEGGLARFGSQYKPEILVCSMVVSYDTCMHVLSYKCCC